MTSVEYNRTVESLQMGSELDFVYDNKRYFLERKGESSYNFYYLPDEGEGVLVKTINAASLQELVVTFLEMPIVDNLSFNEIYSKISDYYVE